MLYTEGLTVGKVNLSQCDMSVIVLKDITEDTSASVETLLEVLSHHIDTLADASHYFVIDPTDTTIMSTTISGVSRRTINHSFCAIIYCVVACSVFCNVCACTLSVCLFVLPRCLIFRYAVHFCRDATSHDRKTLYIFTEFKLYIADNLNMIMHLQN